MKIGVIGIGSIGGTLAGKLAALGHSVRVANSRGVQAVTIFAGGIGATPSDTKGAVDGADAIIIAIPFVAIAKLPNGLLASVPKDVPIIDTGNYYPGMRDSEIPEIDAGMPESIWVSRQLGRSVVKAFNNILAHSLAELGKPQGAEGRLAVAVSGDSDVPRKTAMDIVNQVGFDPVDAGSLKDSWRQQPFTPAYCCDYGAADMLDALDLAVEGDAQKLRANWMSIFGKLPPDPTHDDIIRLNRRENVSSKMTADK